MQGNCRVEAGRTVARGHAMDGPFPAPCKGSCRRLLTTLHSMATQKAVFPRDAGLQARMLLTLFLLGVLYVIFVGALLAAGTGTAVMLVVIGGITLAQLFLSDKL